MRVTVRPARRTCVVVLTWLAAALLGGLVAAPAQAASTPQVSSVRLSVVPTGPIPSLGQVSLIARITPNDAVGRVFFTLKRGTAAATSLNANVVHGVAQVDKVGFSVNGRYVITASFTPSDTGAFDASSSAPRVLVVAPPPTMALFTMTGAPVTANGAVSPRQRLVAQLSGFPARTRVTLRWDRRVLVPLVPVGADGAATAILTLPARLGGGRHLLSASVGQVRTSVVLLSSSPVSYISTRVGATPETEVPDTGDGTPTVTVPKSSGSGSLAHTGANSLPLATVAALMLLAGSAMVGMASRPSPWHAGRTRP